MFEGIANVKNAPLIEPSARIKELQGTGRIIAAREKEALLDAIGNIGSAVGVEIVFQLQEVPDIAAIRMRTVGRADRPVVERHPVETVPQAVLQGKIPGAAFFGFAGLHMNAPLFEAMQCHHVGRVAGRRKPAAPHAVENPRRRVQIHD